MTEPIVSAGQNLVLTIPKSLISDKEIQKIMELLRFYQLVEKSTMTEQKAWVLSEEIKEQWWRENKSRILSKIGMA